MEGLPVSGSVDVSYQNSESDINGAEAEEDSSWKGRYPGFLMLLNLSFGMSIFLLPAVSFAHLGGVGS